MITYHAPGTVRERTGCVAPPGAAIAMTADTTQGDSPQEDTDDLTELEQRILAMREETGIEYVDGATVAATLDADPRDVRDALEALEHDGYLESQPVVYEVLGEPDGDR